MAILLPDDQLPTYLTPEFGNWFSGFFDGEGHFLTQIERADNRKSNSCVVGIQITLRSDDLAILEYIRDSFGAGYIYGDTYQGYSKRQFRIAAQIDVWERVVPMFDKFPLRSKKKNEYPLWREMSAINFERTKRRINSTVKVRGRGRYLSTTITSEEWEIMGENQKKIREMRKYKP